MSPHDCLSPRICRNDGFCRYGTESLGHSLRADVAGRDQRDELFDGSKLVRPLPDCRDCFGRVSVAPVRPYQGPPELGLGMTSRVAPGRGCPAACVEDHETGLADHPPVGGRGLDDERTESVRSPGADPFFDDSSCLLVSRDGLLAQAMHDVGVLEQVVESVRIPRSRRAQAKPVRVEAQPLPGRGVISASHCQPRARPCPASRGPRPARTPPGPP